MLSPVTEEDFIPVILGPAQMNVTLGSTHSLVCQTNQNASSISWRFNGKAVRVCMLCVDVMNYGTSIKECVY